MLINTHRNNATYLMRSISYCLLVCPLGGLGTARAGDAYYHVQVVNESGDSIHIEMLNLDCVRVDTATSFDLGIGWHAPLKFYRDGGGCHGHQGQFNLAAGGARLAGAGTADVQGFWFDAAGGFEAHGTSSGYFWDSSYMGRWGDGAWYQVNIRDSTTPRIVQRLRSIVGVPSRTDPEAFPDRARLGAGPRFSLIYDIGGEGYHESFGVSSGFADAINFNVLTKETQPPYNLIPNLVQLPNWNAPIPVGNGSGDYVVMQGTPLEPLYVNEVARITAPGGRIGLWIDVDRYTRQIADLAAKVHGTATYSTVRGSGCIDEFGGNAGWPKKVCITKAR